MINVFNFLIVFFLILFINLKFSFELITDDTIPKMVNQITNIVGLNIEGQFKNQFNRTCFGLLTDNSGAKSVIKKLGLIPPNELCYGVMYDFTSSIMEYECDSFICRGKGICEFDEYTNFASCINCDLREGMFCLYEPVDFRKMGEGINDIYNILSKRVYVTYKDYPDYKVINDKNDFQAYLKLIRMVNTFYYTSYKYNNNTLFRSVDFINRMLFQKFNKEWEREKGVLNNEASNNEHACMCV